MIQLNFLETNEESIFKEEIRRLRESSDRVRKSLFAKNSELTKNYLELSSRMEILERYICTNPRQNQGYYELK